MNKIAIIGSGSWGIALAVHLAKKGEIVYTWSYSEEEKDLINNSRKCKFLPDIELPQNIICTSDFKEAIRGSEYVLHVTPSKFTRDVVKQYKKYITDQKIIICSKGFEEETLLTLDEVVKQELPNTKIAILSGPSHAEEVSKGIPTAIVVASEHNEILTDIQDLLMNEDLRVYTSKDVKGVEIGGALKNIIAFCAGVASEIGLGDNSFAALITRGLKEISELGLKMGGDKNTFYGLTGLGDLIVTCLSEHSRNRRAGVLVGRGMNLNEVQEKVGMTVESIDNIKVAKELSKQHRVEMPIVNIVYDVLFSGLDPKKAVTLLMTRDKKSEYII